MQSFNKPTQKRTVLTLEHEAYLVQRHGTADLQPLPSMDPNNPYNWLSWKVCELFLLFGICAGHSLQTRKTQICCSFHSSLTTVLNAAAFIPAIPLLIEALHVSLHKITYIIGVQILFLGVGPLVLEAGCKPLWETTGVVEASSTSAAYTPSLMAA